MRKHYSTLFILLFVALTIIVITDGISPVNPSIEEIVRTTSVCEDPIRISKKIPIDTSASPWIHFGAFLGSEDTALSLFSVFNEKSGTINYTSQEGEKQIEILSGEVHRIKCDTGTLLIFYGEAGPYYRDSFWVMVDP